MGLSLLVLWRECLARSRSELANQLSQAYAAHDVNAIEALFCWKGVDVATRSKYRFIIGQEAEYPVSKIVVLPLDVATRPVDSKLSPNLEPDAILEVTFATTDRLTIYHLIGREGWFRHRLVVMLPNVQ